jgi:hypothetical protein
MVSFAVNVTTDIREKTFASMIWAAIRAAVSSSGLGEKTKQRLLESLEK